jgi:endonuclease/exonuclease/phosphatase family metal-dependent hydrolase
VVAEPYRVPDAPRGAGDLENSVAVFWTGNEESPPCSAIERGRGFVAVRLGDMAVVAVYVSPKNGQAEYASFPDELAACVMRLRGRPCLVLGDFNAHATAWGSRRTNKRGREVTAWAPELDLRLVNRGSSSTCVAWRDESIVDLTWANPTAARRVSRWEVSRQETLSDHLYILMDVAVESRPRMREPGHPPKGRVRLPL